LKMSHCDIFRKELNFLKMSHCDIIRKELSFRKCHIVTLF